MAVATVGSLLGIKVTVFVSDHVTSDRTDAIASCGATIHRVKGDALVAETTARAESQVRNCEYISPYNDIDIVHGQGTIGLESFQDSTVKGIQQIDAIYVAVGGGGLIGGVGLCAKSISPATTIVGCWPQASPVLYESIRAGTIVELPDLPTLSVSTSGNVERDSVTFPICRRVIDESVIVSESEILSALRLLYAQQGIMVEGAAGVAMAELLKARNDHHKHVAVVLCGGNVDPQIRKVISSS